MSESTDLEDQPQDGLESGEDDTESDLFSTWDDCAIFRVEALDEPRQFLLTGIGLDAAECMEQSLMALWPAHEQMGQMWTVVKALLEFWSRAHKEFLAACDQEGEAAAAAAAELLDHTNELYYYARVCSDVFDIAFPNVMERQLLEIQVGELLSRRYFDKAGLKAERDALARANEGLLKSIRSKSHKKAKQGQAHESDSRHRGATR